MRALDLRDLSRAAMPTLGDPGALRGAAIGTWHARMINEYASHEVFLALGDQLAACGFGQEARRACLGFADEERRHGVLCGAVVEAWWRGDGHAERSRDVPPAR